MMIDLEKVLKVVKSSVCLAGEDIISSSRSAKISYKSGKEIVTSADLKANQILREHLFSSFPEVGWFSEESEDDRTRLEKKLVWVVDPLDGTKYFVNGEIGFSVAVALIDNGYPILGAVYNPISKSLFYALRGRGAYLDDAPILVTRTNNVNDAVSLVSKTMKSRLDFQKLSSRIPFHESRAMNGTSLRLVSLAKGEGDFYISIGTTEWSIAAADAILREAGGKCTDLQGKPIVYNKPNAYVGHMLASNGILHNKILQLMNNERYSSCLD